MLAQNIVRNTDFSVCYTKPSLG